MGRTGGSEHHRRAERISRQVRLKPDHTYAIVISFVRYTSWMALSSAAPSFIGRWKALRPEMRPMPPARLLITAVFTASFRSLSPDDAPPELMRPMRPM